MKAQFNTTNYRRSHMKEPKGTGSWAFAPAASGDISDPLVFFTPCMTYTEAKKFAVNKYQDAKIFYVLG